MHQLFYAKMNALCLFIFRFKSYFHVKRIVILFVYILHWAIRFLYYMCNMFSPIGNQGGIFKKR